MSNIIRLFLNQQVNLFISLPSYIIFQLEFVRTENLYNYEYCFFDRRINEDLDPKSVVSFVNGSRRVWCVVFMVVLKDNILSEVDGIGIRVIDETTSTVVQF